MFRGIIKCSKCGKPMHYRLSGKSNAWRCTNTGSGEKCPNCYRNVSEDLIISECILSITSKAERIAGDLAAYRAQTEKTLEEQKIQQSLDYLRNAPDPRMVEDQIYQLEGQLSRIQSQNLKGQELTLSAKVFADPKAWQVLLDLPDSRERLRAVFLEYVDSVLVDARGGLEDPVIVCQLRI